MLTVPDPDLPVDTLKRHAAELAQVQNLLKKAESILDRQLGESEGRAPLYEANISISASISKIGGVKMRLETIADAASKA